MRSRSAEASLLKSDLGMANFNMIEWTD